MVTIFFFLFGLAIGSFLNVVIFRCFLTKDKQIDKNIVSSHSVCPNCYHQLAWYDLIPLFSFVFLAGKCRYCKKPISFRYPLIELTTGILFALFSWQLVNGPWTMDHNLWSSFFQLIFVVYSLWTISSLVIIFVVDLQKYIIPNKIIFPLLGISFILEPIWGVLKLKHEIIPLNQFGLDVYWAIRLIYSSMVGTTDFPWMYHQIPDIPAFLNPLITAFLIMLFFILIVFFSRGKGMGIGDVKFAVFLGLFLGWSKACLAIYLAFVIGAGVSLITIIIKTRKSLGNTQDKQKNKKTKKQSEEEIKGLLKQKIPFGPFLITGLLLSWFWSEPIYRLIQGIIDKI